jgi:hypothetical protein
MLLKEWGNWKLVVQDGELFIEMGHYWIPQARWHEPYWVDHVARKVWCTAADASDLFDALEWGKALSASDVRTIARAHKILGYPK